MGAHLQNTALWHERQCTRVAMEAASTPQLLQRAAHSLRSDDWRDWRVGAEASRAGTRASVASTADDIAAMNWSTSA
jgi:hypothetical protein